MRGTFGVASGTGAGAEKRIGESVRMHQTLRVTPAMEAGVRDQLI